MGCKPMRYTHANAWDFDAKVRAWDSLRRETSVLPRLEQSNLGRSQWRIRRRGHARLCPRAPLDLTIDRGGIGLDVFEAGQIESPRHRISELPKNRYDVFFE